jgi:hypothetical protein
MKEDMSGLPNAFVNSPVVAAGEGEDVTGDAAYRNKSPTAFFREYNSLLNGLNYQCGEGYGVVWVAHHPIHEY